MIGHGRGAAARGVETIVAEPIGGPYRVLEAVRA
jgi:hypothetical protein